MTHRLFRLEWDAIAGILAAVVALVLHFLHVIDTEAQELASLNQTRDTLIELGQHCGSRDWRRAGRSKPKHT